MVIDRVEQVEVIGKVAEDVSVELEMAIGREEDEAEADAGKEVSVGDDDVDELLSIDDRILSAG